jgi:hypothetical protein
VKLLAHLVAREGREAALAKALGEAAAALALRAPRGVAAVASMQRVEDDPFGPENAFRGALELRAREGAGGDALAAAVQGLAGRLGDALDAARSTALVGEERVFVAGPSMPVRYQYLMRRRADWTREDYLRYYREHHSRFGDRTPGIRGYVQVYVDPGASRLAAESSGLGTCDVDSVSELHLDSLAHFLDAIATSTIGADAMADEERFVDRARSHAFCSIVTRHGPEPR